MLVRRVSWYKVFRYLVVWFRFWAGRPRHRRQDDRRRIASLSARDPLH